MVLVRNMTPFQQLFKVLCLDFQLHRLRMSCMRYKVMMLVSKLMKPPLSLQIWLFKTTADNSHEAFQATNYSSRGRGSYNNRFDSNRGRGGYSSRGRGFHQQLTAFGGQNTRHTCQIYGRIAHTTLKCWNRFDHNYQHDEIPKALAALHVSAMLQATSGIMILERRVT